jgi:putative ABC transport system permease protein
MRTTDLIATAQTNLGRAKSRTFLTVLAVVIGTFTLAMATSVSTGTRTYIDQQLRAFAQPDTVYVFSGSFSAPSFGNEPEEYDPEKTSASAGQFASLTTKDLAIVKDIEGIESVNPYLVPSADYITAEDKKKYLVSIESFYEGMEADLAAGELIKEENATDILLPYRFLSSFGFDKPDDAIGKSVTLAFTRQVGFEPGVSVPEVRNQTFTVRGVLINSLGGQTAFISREFNEEMASWQRGSSEQFIGIVARTKKDLSTAEITSLKSNLSSKGYIAQTYEDQVSSFQSVVSIAQAVLTFFAAIALLAGTIGIVNTLLMAVFERTQEIGLMKALGAKRGTIFGIFAFESISIGFWGGLIGVALAVGLGAILNQTLSTTLLSGLEGFSLFAFPIADLSGIVLLAMGIGFVAGALPALRASKLDPIEALRHE